MSTSRGRRFDTAFSDTDDENSKQRARTEDSEDSPFIFTQPVTNFVASTSDESQSATHEHGQVFDSYGATETQVQSEDEEATAPVLASNDDNNSVVSPSDESQTYENSQVSVDDDYDSAPSPIESHEGDETHTEDDEEAMAQAEAEAAVVQAKAKASQRQRSIKTNLSQAQLMAQELNNHLQRMSESRFYDSTLEF